MSQTNADRLAKLLGVRNPRKTGTTFTPKAPPKSRTNYSGTRQEAKENALLAAREKQQYLAKLAEERRARRIEGLHRDYPAVRRFLKTLATVEPDCQYTGYRDCDLDLAELATDLDLRSVGEPRDRFLLSEIAHEFVIRLAKRQGLSRTDYFNECDYFAVPDEPPALDQLNHVLGLH